MLYQLITSKLVMKNENHMFMIILRILTMSFDCSYYDRCGLIKQNAMHQLRLLNKNHCQLTSIFFTY
jgi:hypothetical protein